MPKLTAPCPQQHQAVSCTLQASWGTVPKQATRALHAICQRGGTTW